MQNPAPCHALSFVKSFLILFGMFVLPAFVEVVIVSISNANEIGDKTIADAPPFLLHECNAPFLFGFGAWENIPETFRMESEGIRISAERSQGGAGFAGLDKDVSRYADWVPALTFCMTKENKAKKLRLHLADKDETSHSFTFDLEPLKPGIPQRITPQYGSSLMEPEVVEKPGEAAGFGNVSLIMLIGDWSDSPFDGVLSKIELVPPDEQILAARKKYREIQAREAEEARKKTEEKEQTVKRYLEEGAAHPEDGPDVVHVCAVAPDVLALTIQAGKQVGNELRPYAPRPDDEIIEQKSDSPRYSVKDGKVVEYFPKKLYRSIDGNRTEIGLVSPDGKQVFAQGASTGTFLDETAVDEPLAYTIQSGTHTAYSAPKHPLAVFRKGKPNGNSQPLPFLYTVSLQLASPLKENAEYTIRLIGVNTRQKTVAYVHRPRSTRSLAVHANQSGYRSDDPFKRAYVSYWMGVDKNGIAAGCTPEITAFELIDDLGKTVYSGKAERAKQEGEEERICVHETTDYTKSSVYRLDFSGFSAPGSYRVFVPNLGTSYRFEVSDNVWNAPFKAAMRGVFTQRQGIELGPPASVYRRPRVFHPEDGVEFYQMEIPVQAGQEGTRGDHLIKLAESGPLEKVDGVWGGYQDAGDWDSLGHHLSATYQLLGLYDLNPEAFIRTKLSLPEEEANDGLPDILNEALWQMPLWRRLQMPDGGVRGGYGDGWGCYDGETSAMVKAVGVYAVDHETTLHYAGVAARTARILFRFDKSAAAEYLESARRAWNWVERHSSEEDETYKKVRSFHPGLPETLRHLRALAAVELLAATGEERYDLAYRESTQIGPEVPAMTGIMRSDLYLEPYQMEAAFAYARLPEALGDANLKKRIKNRIAAYAEHAIEISRQNSYDIIAGSRTDFPLIFACRYFSTPAQGGFGLIYAYELTGDSRYLAAAVQGSNYCLGANPDNLSYCTGIGGNCQRFNFIVDAIVTGQQPEKIVGHIPYGQGNEGNEMSRGMNGWVQTWLLNFEPTKKMIPNWYDWPVTEQYIDFAKYPLHNENCFNTTSVPAACYWFYLAHRK